MPTSQEAPLRTVTIPGREGLAVTVGPPAEPGTYVHHADVLALIRGYAERLNEPVPNERETKVRRRVADEMLELADFLHMRFNTTGKAERGSY